ncbi:MAG: DUF2007 domain-containing protein [Chitinophagales bacterium]|jgi:hypothetical protein|tara:strand:- start:187 stop:477 length:291 start_codon:yes stop_codon:yes gene_type:complete
MRNLLQIASFSNEIEMAMVRNKLENIGIRTHIKDEHINALREFSSGSMNGVKILVEQDDYNRAMNFLIEIGHYTAGDFEPTWLDKVLHKIFSKFKS